MTSSTALTAIKHSILSVSSTSDNPPTAKQESSQNRQESTETKENGSAKSSSNDQLSATQERKTEVSLLDVNVKKLSDYLRLELGDEPKLSELDLLFNQVAFTFAFNPKVKEVILKEKGAFEFYPAPLKGTTTKERALSCNTVMAVIIPQLKSIYDFNLIIFWRKLVDSQQWDSKLKDFTPDQIREWMKNSEHKNALGAVTTLNLGNIPLEVLPPEVNLLPNLEKLYLTQTKLVEFPHVLRKHPKFDAMQVLVNDKHFIMTSGLS